MTLIGKLRVTNMRKHEHTRKREASDRTRLVVATSTTIVTDWKWTSAFSIFSHNRVYRHFLNLRNLV